MTFVIGFYLGILALGLTLGFVGYYAGRFVFRLIFTWRRP